MVKGGNNLVNGFVIVDWLDEVMKWVIDGGFGYVDVDDLGEGESLMILRYKYVYMYGFIIGDCVWLGDMNFYIIFECDLMMKGEEFKFGGGKTFREGMS